MHERAMSSAGLRESAVSDVAVGRSQLIDRYLLIVGAMKSGTSSLFGTLAQHPAIAAASCKEPGFFAFDDKWARGFAWYESLWRFDARTHKYAMEASTDYAKYPFVNAVAPRLAASAPRRFKLVFMMRHPLRRMEAHARHAAVHQCEVGSRPAPGSHSLDFGPSPVSVAISQYARQLDQFIDYFENGDLLPLTLEQLVHEPEAACAAICEFLDIDPHMQLSPVVRNRFAQKLQQPPKLWRLLRSVDPVRRTGRAVVPQPVRAWLRERTSSQMELTGRYSFTEAEERAYLELLRPDLERLSHHYAVDVTRWWGIDLSQGDTIAGASHGSTDSG